MDQLLTAIKEGYNLPEAYFKADVKRAVVREDITTVLDLQQLTGSRFDNFYVETDRVREADTTVALRDKLRDTLKPYTKLLFSGFVGSGKTTELIKLLYELKDDFHVVIFSAWNRLKIDALTLESFVFEVVEDLLGYISTYFPDTEKDPTLKGIIDKIKDWSSEITVTESKTGKKSRSVGLGIDILKVVFFNAKNEYSASSLSETRSTRIEERKIRDLIFECNRIFDYLKEKTGKSTLFIVDDLEKMSFLKAREFYTHNSSLIRDFHCKMVLTIPVELVFHSDYAIIQNVFGEAEVFPMIKIKDKDGQPYKPGIACMKEILEKRLDLSLFQDECYLEAIKYSGGAMRELFGIIQRAAIIETGERIGADSMRKSINFHKDIFASRIQERDDEIKIKFEEYLEVLFDIDDGNKTTPPRNMALLDLLRTRAVMKYNGEGFYDTHPLLEDFIRDYKKKAGKNGLKSIGD